MKMNMKKKDSWGIVFWVILAVVLLIFMQNATKKSAVEEMPYSQFKQSVKEGKVINAVVTSDLIEGEFTDAEGNVKKFKTIPLDDPKLVEDMENNKVQKFSARAQNGTRFYEGMLTESPSPCRTFCHSEERAQTRSGERTSPTSHGGGKTYTAYRIPRSSIHQVFGGFVQRTTVSIRSFASHIALFYMLRHIIR